MENLEEMREQDGLVYSANRFLRAVKRGERPDANPEAVRLARVISEAAVRRRGVIRKFRDIRFGDGSGEKLEEARAEFWAGLDDVNAEIDEAAEQLARLVESR